jgi:hypothetical protein
MITPQKERPRFEAGAEQAQLRRNQVIAASGTNLLVGVWLICAPFALSYSGVSNALWNDIILGATIATLAGIRVLGAYRQTWLSWTNATLGCWLVIAPFVLGYSDVNNAVGNDIVVGVVVLMFALWSAAASRTGASRR